MGEINIGHVLIKSSDKALVRTCPVISKIKKNLSDDRSLSEDISSPVEFINRAKKCFGAGIANHNFSTLSDTKIFLGSQICKKF